MEIRIEHTTDYPWDLLLLADPNRELVDSYLKTSDCFAAFSGDKPVGVIAISYTHLCPENGCFSDKSQPLCYP